MTTLQKVRNAIRANGGFFDADGHWVGATEGTVDFKAAAVAALKAIREPSDAMLEAADAPGVASGLEEAEGVALSHFSGTGDHIRIWQAMIDAVLAEL